MPTSLLNRRDWLSTLPVTLAASQISLAAAPAPVKLATFSCEVTPPMGHPLMGGGIAPAKSVLDPLFVHGMIFTGIGDQPIVLAAIDWCEIRNDAHDRWRDVIAEAAGTVRERVIVTALHQHDTPIADLTAQKLLEEHHAKGSICMLDFHEQAVQRTAKAVKAALGTGKPVTHVGFGRGKVVGIASNRRYLDPNGVWKHNRMSATRDPMIRAAEDGTIDPEVKTLSFWQHDQPLAVLSGYATHPMSFYGKGEVTADFVGMARRRRQAVTPDAMQIYVSGCSGNVTAGKYNDGSPLNRVVLAEKLEAGMKLAWEATTKQPLTSATFRSTKLTLEPRGGMSFTESDLLAKLKNDPRPFGQCLAALGLSWLRRCQAGRAIDIPVLDFGSAAFVLLPAESYVEYQLFAQEQRANGRLLVAGYGECGPGYIPIERAWKENDGNLSDWCWVAPGSEARMKAAITAAIKG